MNDIDLAHILSEQRAKQPPVLPPPNLGWQPARVRATLEQMQAKILARPLPTPESAQSCEERQRREDALEKSKQWRTFAEKLGPKYLGCRFANFEIPDGPHAGAMEEVLGELERYGQELPARVASAQGVLLYGPPGTGKDHFGDGARTCGRHVRLSDLLDRWNGILSAGPRPPGLARF